MIRFKAMPDDKPAPKAADKPAKAPAKAKASKEAAAPRKDLLDIAPDDADDKD
ncbi:MAG: hypothetical protein Q8S27_11990 [Hoeflea sp.]|uniref:hypothetical protein n=1 Tax=Hoeflea sp. TaxID=1940281 RepID=UPI0027311359|nr:hypothetical protein [Hoeflea sp.]MDP2122022.1 hypothetical protein [Hoeflea sp.]MDP3525293.1 hypothetical protein [Hoeflea sp.]